MATDEEQQKQFLKQQ